MNPQRLLRVEAPHFTAGAVFEKRHNHWRCVKAAPILNWFVRIKHVNVIEDWLLKNHYHFDWLKPISSPEAGTRQADTRAGVTEDEHGTPTQPIKLRWRRVVPAKTRQSRVEKKHMTAETVRINHPQVARVLCANHVSRTH